MQNFAGRTESNLYELILKQKTIGKLGTSNTKIDIKTSFGKLLQFNDGNKIEAKSNFVSVRANNCLIKGKWCYEVLLLSNGLLQIGFCQLNTEFNEHYGVGDDKHSFGYDGYRLSCWNKDENRYGKIWDVGDIIGVCLDLNENKVEYYQNGEKLGIVPINIEHGIGTAYFPAISFSEYEKCFFNFGATTLVYNYEGYEPMDIPKSQYNGSFEVTSLILQSLSHSNLLEFLNKETNDENEIYLKNIVNQKIFYFLTNVSFNDFFLCKSLLFPYMYSLMNKNKDIFFIFLEQIEKNLRLNLGHSSHFFNDFFEKITNIIEEYSIMGPKFYSKYELYTDLFINMINNEHYFKIWSTTGNFFGHLRNIFNSNVVKFGLIYEKIGEIFGDEKYNQNLGNILFTIISEGNIINEEMNNYDEKYINKHKLMIEKIFNYYKNKSTLCQATFIFYDLMRACYPINLIKDYIYDFNTFIDSNNQKNIFAFKNVVLSYISYFLDNYQNIELNKIPIGSVTIIQLPHVTNSIKNELCKTGIYVSYFKEENIGGKSINLIDKTLFEYKFEASEIFLGTNESSSICFNLLTRLISVFDKFFFAYYEFQSLSKDYLYAEYLPNDRGTTFLNALFRYYFYIFNETSQVYLYKISFFLSKWLNYIIISKNTFNVILLPLYIIDFPFQIAQLMLITKSKIIFNDEYRNNINSSCKHFSNDDFLSSLCNIYTSLFEDVRLADYNSLIQSLGWKIHLFLRETKTRNIILKKEEYIKKIIKGISNIFNVNNSERIILRILKVLQRTSFTNEKLFNIEEIKQSDKDKEFIRKILSGNEFKIIIYSIIKYFGQNLNAKLNTYKTNLDNCKQYCLDLNFMGNDLERYITNLKSSFRDIILILHYYEFILNISQENFFNSDFLDLPLIYIRRFFISLTKNILQEPYIGYLIKMLNYVYMKDIKINEMTDSIVNLILVIREENKKSFIDFMVSTKEILINPLLDLYKYKYEANTPYEENMNNKYEQYKILIEEINTKRNEYEEEKHKNQKDIEYLDDDYLCSICYTQIANYNIIPCFHKGCRDCLLAYLADNDKCFMCRQPYDSVVKISDEEIQKIIKEAKETDKGEKNDNDDNE